MKRTFSLLADLCRNNSMPSLSSLQKPLIRFGSLALAAACCLGLASVAQAQSYNGVAYTIFGDIGGVASYYNRVDLPADGSGGSFSSSQASINIKPNVFGNTKATDLFSAITGTGGATNASASANSVVIDASHAGFNITADAVSSSAYADTTSASSLFSVTNLKFNGNALTVGTGQNQRFDLSSFYGISGSYIELNRVTDLSTADTYGIQVIALTAYVPGRYYVEVGASQAMFTPAAIPEPAFYQMTALLAFGGLGVLRSRRKKAQP